MALDFIPSLPTKYHSNSQSPYGWYLPRLPKRRQQITLHRQEKWNIEPFQSACALVSRYTSGQWKNRCVTHFLWSPLASCSVSKYCASSAEWCSSYCSFISRRKRWPPLACMMVIAKISWMKYFSLWNLFSLLNLKLSNQNKFQMRQAVGLYHEWEIWWATALENLQRGGAQFFSYLGDSLVFFSLPSQCSMTYGSLGGRSMWSVCDRSPLF